MTYSQRPARPGDAAAVAELLYASDAALLDDPERLSEQDVRDWWRRLVDGGNTVVEVGGRLAGYGAVMRDGPVYAAFNFVHPEHTGREIGLQLLDWAEGLARTHGVGSIRAHAMAPDAAARRLLESRGFSYLRSSYRMVVDLDGPPPAPEWPAGFELATLGPGEERMLHATLEDAFADHWDYHPLPFEEWLAGPKLDPALCFLVRAEDEVAAAEVCQQERFGMGWIRALGVRPPWRRRGLGRALLLHAFGRLHGRGQRRIGLGVDAENTTGAVRLYERAGMRVAWRSDAYQKQLAPVP